MLRRLDIQEHNSSWNRTTKRPTSRSSLGRLTYTTLRSLDTASVSKIDVCLTGNGKWCDDCDNRPVCEVRKGRSSTKNKKKDLLSLVVCHSQCEEQKCNSSWASLEVNFLQLPPLKFHSRAARTASCHSGTRSCFRDSIYERSWLFIPFNNPFLAIDFKAVIDVEHYTLHIKLGLKASFIILLIPQFLLQ
jgi:hypothetical protein